MLGLMLTMPDGHLRRFRAKLRLDARNLPGVSGTTVVQWDDQSGNAKHLTQGAADAAKRFTTIRGGANGPVAKADGVDDAMQTPAVDLTAHEKVTWVVCCEDLGTALGGGVVVESSASYAVNVGGTILAYAVTILGDVDFGCRGDVSAVFKVTTAAQGGMRRFVLESDYSLAGTAEVLPYSDNAVPTTANGGGDNTGTSHGNLVFYLGARNGGTGLFFFGNVAHVVVFPGVMATAERDMVDRVLRFWLRQA